MDRTCRRVHDIVALAIFFCFFGCGGNVSSSLAPNGGPAPAPGAASAVSSGQQVQHVVLVVEENHSYESVIGSPDMPYLNSLANRYAIATSYYANVHPSIGNYFMLTTGSIVTIDDSYTGTVTGDNLARILNSAGKSWKMYAESLPSVGYLGGDAPPYLKHHNPFSFFSDVVGNPAQANNIVPFTQFASDLSSGGLPNFAFVVPNANNDAHDGTLATADAWLQANIDPLINNPAFQQSGLLLIVFDEGALLDLSHGGGHVAAVLVGSKVKSGYKSGTLFQHESALRLILESLGVNHLPGAAAGAPSMSEMLQ